ncbi:progranulin-like [Tigriopus californicus]|uniref:progranulin-like n=1 Tax=Tigriopus californicus TaxID=6832 RepID=UPI0027DA5C69|nr:progranulin-like [Tigriopus californicus]
MKTALFSLVALGCALAYMGMVMATPALAPQPLSDMTACNGTQCGGGCCPIEGWYCCEGGHYCALGSSDCPGKSNMVAPLEPVASLKPFLKAGDEPGLCEDGEFACDNGCCPNMGWFCCEDGKNCAASADKCPTVKRVKNFSALFKTTQCDGTVCPVGCCPHQNWVCCEFESFCADQPTDCPEKPL